MANHTEAVPQLPPASVDFNALHDACRAGKTQEEALKAAIFEETLASPPLGSDAAPPADQGKDALDDLLKPDLQARARGLGIAFASDATVDDLKAALRADPRGVPSTSPAAE